MTFQPELPWEDTAQPHSRPAPTGRRSPRPSPAGARARRAGVQDGAEAAVRPGARRVRGSGTRATGRRGARGATRRATRSTPAPVRAFVVDEEWRLDEATRRNGRRGLAEARATLARAAARAGHAA